MKPHWAPLTKNIAERFRLFVTCKFQSYKIWSCFNQILFPLAISIQWELTAPKSGLLVYTSQTSMKGTSSNQYVGFSFFSLNFVNSGCVLRQIWLKFTASFAYVFSNYGGCKSSTAKLLNRDATECFVHQSEIFGSKSEKMWNIGI